MSTHKVPVHAIGVSLALLLGCAGGGDARSTDVPNLIGDAAPGSAQAMDALREAFWIRMSELEAGGKTTAAAAAEMARIVAAQPGIVAAGVAPDGTTVVFETEDEVQFQFLTASPKADAQMDAVSSPLDPTPSRSGAKQGALSPGSRKAVLFLPFENESAFNLCAFGTDHATLRTTLEAQGYTVTELLDSAASVEALEVVLGEGPGLLVFQTHGGGGAPVLLPGLKNRTGVTMATGTHGSDADLRPIVKARNAQTTNAFLMLSIGKCGAASRYVIGFNPEAVRKNVYPGTLVWAGGCHTLDAGGTMAQDTSMAGAFLDAGASVYLGFVAEVYIASLGAGVTKFFETLSSPGGTVQSAWASVTNDAGLNDPEVLEDMGALAYLPVSAGSVQLIDPACVPRCSGKECGDDGCGGSCGSCGSGACDQGICVETCSKTCASEGCACGQVCGESCGTCGALSSCSDGCHCTCVPQCDQKECGDDGCGGTCGTCVGGAPCTANRCTRDRTLCELVMSYSAWPKDPECTMCSTGLWSDFSPDVDSQCLLDCLATKSVLAVCGGARGLPDLCPECVKECGPYPCACVPDFTVTAGRSQDCGAIDTAAACQTLCGLKDGTLCAGDSAPEIAVCPGSAPAGTAFAVNGRNLTAGRMVTLKLEHGSLGTPLGDLTATPGSKGTIELDLQTPQDAHAGLYRVRAEDADGNGLTDWVEFRIL